MIGVLETISFGISLIKEGKSLYDSLTGNTVAGADALSGEFEKLKSEVIGLKQVTAHLAVSDVQEVHRHSGQTQIIEDVSRLYGPMTAIQETLGADLIQSQPIRTPEKLMNVFEENPERLLSNIRPLAGFDLDTAVPEDRTMLPVVFERYGVQFVGWMKNGVLSLSLDTDYEPNVLSRIRGSAAPSPLQATSRSQTSPARQEVPERSSAPRPRGDALRVGGPGGIGTIAEAITRATEGQIVEVMPGRYSGGVRIDRPVEIVGIGDPGEIVWEAAAEDVVTWSAAGGRIANMTLRQVGTMDLDCIRFVGGASATLEDCVLTGTGLAVVSIEGDADPVVRANLVHDSGGSGIVLTDAAKGNITGNDIRGCAYSGLVIRAGANPIVDDNAICANKGDGVLIEENGKGIIENNRIFDNEFSGISVTSGGAGLVGQNEIFANGFAGIAIQSGGNPIVRDNTIRDGQGDGVRVHANGSGLLERNEIFGNASSGISVSDGSNPLIEANRIRDGKADGVLCSSGAEGTFKDNEIFGNAFNGISVTGGANPFVTGNAIRDGQNNGVYVYDEGRGLFENNEITGNAGAGLVATAGGDPFVKGNSILRNGADGIWVQEGGKGHFEANDLRDNAYQPRHVDESAGPTTFVANTE